MPALLTRMSRRSCRSWNMLANDCTAANVARSSGNVSTRSPARVRSCVSLTAAAAFDGLRAAITTCAPCWASATAVSLPIPLLPPVMTATLPWSPLSLMFPAPGSFGAGPLGPARCSADPPRDARSCLGRPLGEARRPVFAGLSSHPLDQLVTEEPDLPAAGEAVGRHPALTHHSAQVLDVDVEQLGGHRRGEDRRRRRRALQDLARDGLRRRVGHGESHYPWLLTTSRDLPHISSVCEMPGPRFSAASTVISPPDTVSAFVSRPGDLAEGQAVAREVGVCGVGVSICEDAWSPDGPILTQAAGGAELIVNLNASTRDICASARRCWRRERRMRRFLSCT